MGDYFFIICVIAYMIRAPRPTNSSISHHFKGLLGKEIFGDLHVFGTGRMVVYGIPV